MPVWQNEQVSVQPTWLEMQSVPRSLSGNVDGFDLRRASFVAALGKPQQPLARAVDRDLLGDDLRTVERVECFEATAQILRDVRHVFEARHAAHVDPAPELADAHAELLFGNAGRGERGLQPVARQARERRLRGCERLFRS